MALEWRNGRPYYYTSRRVGSRVVREYGGSGTITPLAAQLDALQREQRRDKALDRREAVDRFRRRTTKLRQWLARVAATVADGLRAAGWHQHNREWRRKRGTAMAALTTAPTPEQARATWDQTELTALAGQLDPAAKEKAGKGDTSVVREVDAFLDNPAAAALWGDLGRRVLQRWIETYAGECLTTRRAVWRFASDLRARLAGPRPSALDHLLAERVVVGWVFLNWCEAQYGRQMAKLTWKESEYHTRRIEMAHRTLMSACRTLAKVKKGNLPDLLAVVAVAPPAAPLPSAGGVEDTTPV